MKTIHQFDPAGHRDGPTQPRGTAGMAPKAHTESSGQAPSAPMPGAQAHRTDNRKPESARPHAGSGGTRNMAQNSNTAARVPMGMPGPSPAVVKPPKTGLPSGRGLGY